MDNTFRAHYKARRAFLMGNYRRPYNHRFKQKEKYFKFDNVPFLNKETPRNTSTRVLPIVEIINYTLDEIIEQRKKYTPLNTRATLDSLNIVIPTDTPHIEQKTNAHEETKQTTKGPHQTSHTVLKSQNPTILSQNKFQFKVRPTSHSPSNFFVFILCI